MRSAIRHFHFMDFMVLRIVDSSLTTKAIKLKSVLIKMVQYMFDPSLWNRLIIRVVHIFITRNGHRENLSNVRKDFVQTEIQQQNK